MAGYLRKSVWMVTFSEIIIYYYICSVRLLRSISFPFGGLQFLKYLLVMAFVEK